MRRKIALALAVSGALYGGAVAQASASNVSVSHHRLFYTAASGETNHVTITAAGGNATVTDSAGVTADGVTCTQDTANQATCAGVTMLTAKLNDGDDVFDDSSTALPSNVYGGAGNDTITTGSGADYVLGEGGVDQISTGAGDDRIVTMGGYADEVSCGDGQDTVDSDSLDHLDASCETTSTPPPPPPGSGEAPPPSNNGQTPVPVIVPSPKGTPSPIKVPKGRCPTLFRGFASNDRIDGTGAGDRMFGMRGNDVLNGLGGADCLYGMAGRDAVYGGQGTDRLYGGRGNDRLFGGPGGDWLYGGKGKDRMYGNAGKNRYFGGAGNDRIYARNGKADRINCGRGRDVARVDNVDRVKGCEKVIAR